VHVDSPTSLQVLHRMAKLIVRLVVQRQSTRQSKCSLRIIPCRQNDSRYGGVVISLTVLLSHARTKPFQQRNFLRNAEQTTKRRLATKVFTAHKDIMTRTQPSGQLPGVLGAESKLSLTKDKSSLQLALEPPDAPEPAGRRM